MNRRSFIRSVLGALAASQLPLPSSEPRVLLVAPTEEAAKLYLKQYMLGFRVSREMIEDDIYGVAQHIERALLRRALDM